MRSTRTDLSRLMEALDAQAYLVEIYSARYFCPQYESQAAINLGQSPLGGS